MSRDIFQCTLDSQPTRPLRRSTSAGPAGSNAELMRARQQLVCLPSLDIEADQRQ